MHDAWYTCLSMLVIKAVFLLLLQTDEDILTEVIKMGFDKDALIESLRNRVQNEVPIYVLKVLGQTVCFSVADLFHLL